MVREIKEFQRHLPMGQSINIPLAKETTRASDSNRLAPCRTNDTKIPADNPTLIDTNKITKHFFVGLEAFTAGAEKSWRVYYARRKKDDMECSVWVFYKSQLSNMRSKYKKKFIKKLRLSIKRLNRIQHPKLVQVIHYTEETSKSIAFATEPILGAYNNVLEYMRSRTFPEDEPLPIMPFPMSLADEAEVLPSPAPIRPGVQAISLPYHERRIGLLSLVHLVDYLHQFQQVSHGNLSPATIFITKFGEWKIAGLEFMESFKGKPYRPTKPYKRNMPEFAQRNLDYIDPEGVVNKRLTLVSDLHSLALTICTSFNCGVPLIDANNDLILYLKQLEHLKDRVKMILPRIPSSLREIVERILLTDRKAHPLPMATSFTNFHIEYIHGLESDNYQTVLDFLVNIHTKDIAIKYQFYRYFLISILEEIPEKVRKEFIWPALKRDINHEILGPVVSQILLWFLKNQNHTWIKSYVAPDFKRMLERDDFIGRPSLLPHIDVIIVQADKDALMKIMPVFYKCLCCEDLRLTIPALVGLNRAIDTALTNYAISHQILPQLQDLLEDMPHAPHEMIKLILQIYGKAIYRVSFSDIENYIIPGVVAVRNRDHDIMSEVMHFCRLILRDEKFMPLHYIVAKNFIPNLLLQTHNQVMTLDEFKEVELMIFELLAVNKRYSSRKNNGFSKDDNDSPDDDAYPPKPPGYNHPKPNFGPNNPRRDRDGEDKSTMNTFTQFEKVAPRPSTSSGFTGKRILEGAAKLITNPFESKKEPRATEVPKRTPVPKPTTLSVPPQIDISSTDGTTQRMSREQTPDPRAYPGRSADPPSRRHSSISPQNRRHLSAYTQEQLNRARASSAGRNLNVPGTSRNSGGNAATNFLRSTFSPTRSRRSSHPGLQRTVSDLIDQGSGLFNRRRSPVRGPRSTLFNQGSELLNHGAEIINQGTDIINQGTGFLNQLGNGVTTLFG